MICNLVILEYLGKECSKILSFLIHVGVGNHESLKRGTFKVVCFLRKVKSP